MRNFNLTLLESNSYEEDFTFQLEENANVFDLKKAFTEKEGYTPEELRLIYRRQEGHDEPLEDTELLQDIEKHPGFFLLECPSLGMNPLDGQISVFVDYNGLDEDDDICVLIGSTKNFEHFRLTNERSNLKVPNSKL